MLINYPPEGYKFLVPPGTTDTPEGLVHLIKKDVLRKMMCFGLFEKSIEHAISLTSVCYSKLYGKVFPKKSDLTYSCQHLVFRKEPWVVDLEFATALVSYGRFGLTKSIVERALSSDYCKRIMPWTDTGKETLLKCLDCRKFEEKIETVHLAVPPKNFVKRYDNEKMRILFVGTGNPWNVAGSFQLKGGREVLMAFKQLNERYKNLELIFKSYVPEDTSWTKSKNIRIINRVVSWQTLSMIFKTSDIFLFPTHSTPGMVILDAMSYELPVITTDVWANREMVQDGKTGFLIEGAKGVAYYDKNFIPLWGGPNFTKTIRNIDPEMVRELVEKTIILIEDERLRRRMGRAARKEIETGKFSIKRRNEKLERIFDEAIID